MTVLNFHMIKHHPLKEWSGILRMQTLIFSWKNF